jgi:type III restriction enzyme
MGNIEQFRAAEITDNPISTQANTYNFTWAVVKQKDDKQKIYMIRETKSTPIDGLLRPTEVSKIDCGKKHFSVIDIDDGTKASPLGWRLREHE